MIPQLKMRQIIEDIQEILYLIPKKTYNVDIC